MAIKSKIRELIESKSWQEIQFLINENKENLEFVIEIIIKNTPSNQRQERIKYFWQIVTNSDFSYDYIKVINDKLTSLTTEKTRKSIFELLKGCPIKLIDDFVDTIISIEYLVYTKEYALFIDKLPNVSEQAKNKLKTAIINSENTDIIYEYAKYIKNPPVEEIRSAILKIGNVEFILKTAIRFGFTKELLEVIMKSNNPMFMLIAACRLNSKETIELSVNLVKLIDDLIEPEIKLEFAQENNIDSVESAKKFFINFFKKVCVFHEEDIGEWDEEEVEERNQAIEEHLKAYLFEDYLGTYGEMFNNKKYQSFSDFISNEFGIAKKETSEKTM